MACVLDTTGPRVWGGGADESGHRTYQITFRVNCDKEDGPALVQQTPGLPLPGSVWWFGNDIDVYAWCRPGFELRPAPEIKVGRPITAWDVTQTFSTRPAAAGGGTSSGRPGSGSAGGNNSGNRQGCHDARIEDPLLEPMGVSGSFVKRVEEASHDRHGNPLMYSSWEPISGPAAEVEVSNPTVVVEQNVPLLQLDLCTGMKNTLNELTLWGLPPRTWKLVSFDWERKYHGQCFVYYVRRFTFEANYRLITDPFTGEVVLAPAWDKTVDDYSSMVLKGHWGTGADTPASAGTASEGTGWVLDSIDEVTDIEPDPLNPGDFVQYVDRHGNPTKVMLNGAGMPYDPADSLRSFYWVYIVSNTPNTTLGTYADAQALSDNDHHVTGVADVYGPFYSDAQATAAAADPDLFISSRYRGWSDSTGFPAPGRIRIEHSGESNFLLLGIPTVL